MLYTLLALLLMQTNVVSAQTPDYLQIKKVKIDGIDAYSTPYFNFSSTDSSLKGKVIYIKEKSFSYIKNQARLVFFIQDNSNETIITKLKDFAKNNSRHYSITVVAEPESFYIYKPKEFRCIGEDWDGYEECPVVYIGFNLEECRIDANNEKSRYKYFKKMIKKSRFKKIRIGYSKEIIEIPLDIPINEIIHEIEKL